MNNLMQHFWEQIHCLDSCLAEKKRRKEKEKKQRKIKGREESRGEGRRGTGSRAERRGEEKGLEGSGGGEERGE